MEVRSDREFHVPDDREEVWAAFERVGEYPTWWPWLGHLDAERLATGERWSCVVRPPVPYLLRLEIHLISVVEPSRIEAVVTGDIAGTATLELSAHDHGTSLRLDSTLRARHGGLGLVTAAAPWLARFGHDWVLDTGFRQFRDRALDR